MTSREKRELRLEERIFLRKVQQAIFTNPFTAERLQVDREIVGSLPLTNNKTRERALERHVVGKLSEIIGNDSAALAAYAGEDRILLEHGILFSIYHHYCGQFDNLIAEQIRAGDAPCPVPFAPECLELMRAKGLAASEAERNFALFFQIRRAFYFIDRIVGPSSCMQELRCNLWHNVFTSDIGLYERYLWNRMEDFSTMLLGETGTGKGMAASAIGRSGHIPFDGRKGRFSESFSRAFVALNLSQFPEQLLESELFGHTKGAFTGAVENHQGIFARCSPHGSIFLDEIGEVSAPVQVKLLNVLQERIFSPVGSHQQLKFQGRVIAATNRDLATLRSSGEFRADFYYRLCSDIIQVPPLRQRLREDPNELSCLLSIMVKRIVGNSSPELVELLREKMALSLPADYPWPGNVRELEQCVRRLLLKQRYEGNVPAAKELPLAEILNRGISDGTLQAKELLALYCRILYDKLGTYEAVASRIDLDRRTVKKYITNEPQ